MNSEPISVMVVDDHPIWRDGVARDLGERGFALAGTAPDGEAAVRIAGTVLPDVVLMDLDLGDVSGVEATRTITARHGETRILVVSASGEHADVLEAVKAGASGYILKSASITELVDAIGRTANGETVFTAGLAGLVLGEYRRIASEEAEQPAAPGLTERETEVLRQVAKGRTAKQVAERLFVSHRTVENHVQTAMRKLQLHNRADVVRYAIEHGIDEDEAAE